MFQGPCAFIPSGESSPDFYLHGFVMCLTQLIEALSEHKSTLIITASKREPPVFVPRGVHSSVVLFDGLFGSSERAKMLRE